MGPRHSGETNVRDRRNAARPKCGVEGYRPKAGRTLVQADVDPGLVVLPMALWQSSCHATIASDSGCGCIRDIELG